MTDQSREHSEAAAEGPGAGEARNSTPRAHAQDAAEGPEQGSEAASTEESTPGEDSNAEAPGENPHEIPGAKDPEG
jgi:hypothetical protein